MNNHQNKKQGKPPKNTIDEKHTEMMDSFHKIETTTIPQLIEEESRLKTYIKTLKENQIEEFMDTQDKIKDIKKKRKDLLYEKKKYLLDNAKHIFDYFEEKKKISSGNNNQNSNVLNMFFKIKAKTDGLHQNVE